MRTITRTRAFLFAVLVGGLALPRLARAEADYEPENTRWNGLSRLMEIISQEGYQAEVRDQLDWSKADPKDPLLFFYPIRPDGAAPKPSEVADFLREGGRVVIADDFGAAGETFQALGILRSTELPSGVEAYGENPSLPFAEPVPGHPLGSGLDLVLTNHPAVFSSDLTLAMVLGRPPTNAEPNAQLSAVVVEGGLDEGRILAISDPSIFINAMIDYPGNERFVKNLLLHVAGPPPGSGKFIVYTGRFGEWGQAEDDPGDTQARFTALQDFLRAFNDWLGDLSRFTPKGELGRVMAALLVLSGLFGLLARLVQPPTRYDGRWLGGARNHPGPLRPQHEARPGASQEASAATFQVAVESFLHQLETPLPAYLPGERKLAERRLTQFLSRLSSLSSHSPSARIEAVYREWISMLEAANLVDRWKRRARG